MLLKNRKLLVFVIINVVVLMTLTISLLSNYKKAKTTETVINLSYTTLISELSVASLDLDFYSLYKIDPSDTNAVVGLYDLLQYSSEYNRMISAHSRLIDFLIMCAQNGYIELPPGHILTKQHPYIPASDSDLILTAVLSPNKNIGEIKDNLDKAFDIQEKIHTIVQKYGVNSNIYTGLKIIEEISSIWYNEDGGLR